MKSGAAICRNLTARLVAAISLKQRWFALRSIGDSAIFTRLYIDSARSTADAADRRLQFGGRLGPLDGEIVTIKDVFDVAGEPTTAGSAMLA